MPDKNQTFPFALIPAAGRSRRMGLPKLLLDVNGQTVIGRVLTALAQAGLRNRIVVIHPDDESLKREVERYESHALVPATAPPEMRDSIAFGLQQVKGELEARTETVNPQSPWILIPADHPVVIAETVRMLLDAAAQSPGRIIVPTHSGRRGHPAVFAWRHALEVDQIPAGEGFNWLVRREAARVVEVPVASPSVLFDLDTPDDYERLRQTWEMC
jgi:molybdenum cofactor cytidylyltransferase